MGGLGSVLEGLGAVLGRSWGGLGGSWDGLGRPWGAGKGSGKGSGGVWWGLWEGLGGVWGVLGGVFGALGRGLGGVFGVLGRHLAPYQKPSKNLGFSLVFEGFWLPEWPPKATETLQNTSRRASEAFPTPIWIQETKKSNQDRLNKAPKTTKTGQSTENKTKKPRSKPPGA